MAAYYSVPWQHKSLRVDACTDQYLVSLYVPVNCTFSSGCSFFRVPPVKWSWQLKMNWKIILPLFCLYRQMYCWNIWQHPLLVVLICNQWKQIVWTCRPLYTSYCSLWSVPSPRTYHEDAPPSSDKIYSLIIISHNYYYTHITWHTMLKVAGDRS